MTGKHRRADWDDVSKEVGAAVNKARDEGKTVDKDKAVQRVKDEYKGTTGKDAS